MHSILKYAGKVEAYPFPHVVIENAHDEYDALASSFPMVQHKGGNNLRRYLDSTKTKGPIAEFFKYHTSRSFADEVCDLFDVARFKPDKMVGHVSVNTPVLKRSSVKGPHLDHSSKFWQGLFYMPVAEDTAGGDLQFYDCPEPRLANTAVYGRAVVNHGDPVKRIPYLANLFVCYLNSRAAVHGVSEREVTGLLRRYINLSIIRSVRHK